MAATEFAQRRERLCSQFAEWKIDAFLVSSLVNVRYLTGFTGSSALLLLGPRRTLLLTDGRYATQVRQEADCPSRIIRGSNYKAIPAILKRWRIRYLGIEAADLTVESHMYLAAESGPATALIPVSGAVEHLRRVKSASEIELIRAAVQLTSDAFAKAIRRIKPGIREKELAAEIDFQMLRGGADKPAFETIVAFGSHSALPHARPTANSLQSNELLLIDMGSQRQGYASDMTRVAHVGAPSPKIRRLYRAVLDSQLAALDAVRPGVTAHAVDRAARSTLRTHGLDKLFLHSTGHGLGLYIHEPPRLGRKETAVLEAGMAITIEPGAYQEGLGGVRIEDTVLVTATGCEVLTPTSKELIVL
jgi:Xaa-Pro aminopeptidase